MKTIKRRTHVPQKPHINASLLLTMLLLMSMAGVAISIAGIQFKNQRIAVRITHSLLAQTQAQLLMHNTCRRLQQLATPNAVAMAIKDGHLHFYDIRGADPIPLGTLDEQSDTHCVMVQPLMPDAPEPLCCFQQEGMRIPLENFMQQPEHLRALNFFTEEQITCAIQRWQILQQSSVLPIPLFRPILKAIGWRTGRCALWNPYDRLLQGRVQILYRVRDRMLLEHEQQTFLDVQLQLGATMQVFLPLLPGITLQMVVMGNEVYRRVGGPPILRRWNLLRPLQEQYGAVFVPQHQALPYDAQWMRDADGIVCRTTHWNERLNVCFYFDWGHPYLKIGNFLDPLNRFVLNEVVPNPHAVPFYFNGPRAYLKSVFQTMLGNYIGPQELERCVFQIEQRQPFSNACDFLKFLFWESLPTLCETALHVFEALSARVEQFTIVAQVKYNGRWYPYCCTITRDPVTTRWSTNRVNIRKSF